MFTTPHLLPMPPITVSTRRRIDSSTSGLTPAVNPCTTKTIQTKNTEDKKLLDNQCNASSNKLNAPHRSVRHAQDEQHHERNGARGKSGEKPLEWNERIKPGKARQLNLHLSRENQLIYRRGTVDTKRSTRALAQVKRRSANVCRPKELHGCRIYTYSHLSHLQLMLRHRFDVD